jgi:hypothetical protein
MALGLALLPLTSAHAGSTWLVGIKASRVQVAAGHKIVFKGTVRPHSAAAGEKVVLQEKFKPGKKWADQRKAKVQKDGSYRVTDTPTSNFTHAYRIVMPTTSKHSRGVSPTVKVKVYGWTRLADLAFVNDEGMGTGSVNINGKAYEHSVFAIYPWDTDSYVEYNLNHGCTRLQASFGISDASSTGGQAQVTALSDGTPIYTHTFDVGQHQTKTVALDNPLKLRLESTSTSTGGAFGLGAFGNATVFCTR